MAWTPLVFLCLYFELVLHLIHQYNIPIRISSESIRYVLGNNIVLLLFDHSTFHFLSLYILCQVFIVNMSFTLRIIDELLDLMYVILVLLLLNELHTRDLFAICPF